jgi:hypothetical protein
VSETFLFYEEFGEKLSQVYMGLHVKYLFLYQTLIKLELPLEIFEKYSNVKLNEHPLNGSRVVPCGRTDEADMTKLSRCSQFCERAYNLLPTSGAQTECRYVE